MIKLFIHNDLLDLKIKKEQNKNDNIGWTHKC